MISLAQNNFKASLISFFAISALGGVFLFDQVLATGILLLFVLSISTFVALKLTGIYRTSLLALFLIVLSVHFGAALFINYFEFYPFGGGQGDQGSYHIIASELSQNFSLDSISQLVKSTRINNYFAVVVGALYAITTPALLIGQLLNVWLVAITAIVAYLISVEIGVSKKLALLSGFLVGMYPSYLYFGSMLLRETFVVLFALVSLLFIIKIIKNFSWRNFIVFYIATIGLVHFRFYIGFAMIGTFILLWPIIQGLNLKKKILYGIFIIVALGFIPQFTGYGYYGNEATSQFLSPEKIEYMREKVYVSSGSTVTVETGFENPATFVKNYFTSFLFVFVGPLPWHIKYTRHLFVLAEIIPMYLLYFLILKGVINSKSRWKIILPLLLFPLGVFMVISLFIDNFGIYMRIRMPAFIALFSLVPLYLDSSSKYKIFEDKVVTFVKNIKR